MGRAGRLRRRHLALPSLCDGPLPLPTSCGKGFSRARDSEPGAEALRGGADDDRARLVDLDHREAALDAAVGAEAEDAVEAEEAVLVVERLGGEVGTLVAAGQCGGERGCVVAERREPRRRVAVERLEALLEIRAAGRIGRRVPGAVEIGLGEQRGIVPESPVPR